jgi:hypothetical protein
LSHFRPKLNFACWRFTAVRYEAVNAMLLNEFLKEHCKVEQQQATIGRLKFLTLPPSFSHLL